MRILWSPQSLGDLDAIHASPEYFAKDSEHYAGLTISRIFSAVEQLIQFPHSGRIVPERDEPAIREVIVGRFRVVYRIQDELIEVATVFRASREFPEKF
jgi:plasmid stabilization system protein ParE